MGKDKLKRFGELGNLDRVFQPDFREIFKKDFYLKGQWKQKVFNNNNPLVLELGCGKGEYTVGLARLFPLKNFIGIDIKGARMWRGAKTSNEDQILNSGFLRTRIEFIDSFFAAGEVDEVWITFPDPQLKTRRVKKRLTNAAFLNEYRKFLVDGGIVHLKTDSKPLYDYTLQLAQYNNLEILVHTDDLYNSLLPLEVPDIRTFYENEYLNKGCPITYLKFRLKPDKEIMELVVSG